MAIKRIVEFERELYQEFPTQTILYIGHRALYYALKHTCYGVPLEELVIRPWKWQPGWKYYR